jgi:hypothetical protein
MGVAVLTSWACADERDPDAIVAAYLFLHEDRREANDYWDPITMCNGYSRCSASGFVHGLQGASASRVASGGWAIELEFDRGVSAADIAALQAELDRRAGALGLGSVTLLRGGDQWPSCRGEPDCLTVDESIGA